jgi:integrase
VSIYRLPSGRWGAQVHVPGRGNVRVSKILGPQYASFRTKTEAKDARTEARRRINGGHGPDGITVHAFADLWTTDRLFARPKRSTNIHNAERIRAFVDAYGDLPLRHVGDLVVAQYLAGGRHNSTIPALRAMFNDAMSAKAGRLVAANPFANLGISRGTGNKHRRPPTEDELAHMLRHARELTPPSFAAYLEAGCLTAMRPSELDALRWPQIDFGTGEINVNVQWSAKIREFDTPKYGPYVVALVEPAKQLLLSLPREDFVFTTLRGTHYTPSSRTHHWNRVRSAAGLGHMTLYLATRHYFGWYAVNVLQLDPAIVAEQLGHKDGGRLVEQLYGHPDKRLRRAKIRDAYKANTKVRPLRSIRKDEPA